MSQNQSHKSAEKTFKSRTDAKLLTDNKNYVSSRRKFLATGAAVAMGVAATVSRTDADPPGRPAESPWVDAQKYGRFFDDKTIKAALAVIGSEEATLLLAPGAWRIENDLIIPANVTLIIFRGAMLEISPTATLTINGSVQADIYQIFTGVEYVPDSHITGVIFNGSVREFYPQWWGAHDNGSPENAEDTAKAIQAAIDAAARIQGIVFLSHGEYYIGEFSLYLYGRMTFQGASYYGYGGQYAESRIIYTGNEAALWVNPEGIEFNGLVTNISLDGKNTGNCGLKIGLDRVPSTSSVDDIVSRTAQGAFRDIRIKDFGECGIHAIGSQIVRYENIWCENNGNADNGKAGIYLDDHPDNFNTGSVWTSCRFRRNKRGIYIRGLVGSTFEHCTIESNTSEGVLIEYDKKEQAGKLMQIDFRGNWFEDNNKSKFVDGAQFKIVNKTVEDPECWPQPPDPKRKGYCLLLGVSLSNNYFYLDEIHDDTTYHLYVGTEVILISTNNYFHAKPKDIYFHRQARVGSPKISAAYAHKGVVPAVDTLESGEIAPEYAWVAHCDYYTTENKQSETVSQLGRGGGLVEDEEIVIEFQDNNTTLLDKKNATNSPNPNIELAFGKDYKGRTGERIMLRGKGKTISYEVERSDNHRRFSQILSSNIDSITPDIAKGRIIRVNTLSNDLIINAPMNAREDDEITILVEQPDYSGYDVFWGDTFKVKTQVDMNPSKSTNWTFWFDGTLWWEIAATSGL